MSKWVSLILTSILVVAAACGPVEGGQRAAGSAPPQHTPVSSPASSDDAAACTASGGTVRAVCRMQTQRCVIAFPDAGRRCTDGDQCAGDCILAEDGKRGEGAGVCQANDDPCGCRTRIEDGRETATLCVD